MFQDFLCRICGEFRICFITAEKDGVARANKDEGETTLGNAYVSRQLEAMLYPSETIPGMGLDPVTFVGQLTFLHIMVGATDGIDIAHPKGAISVPFLAKELATSHGQKRPKYGLEIGICMLKV